MNNSNQDTSIEKTKMTMKKKKKNPYYLVFNISFWLITIALVLISSTIIPWDKVVPGSEYNFPLWLRITLSALYPIIILGLASLFLFYKQISIYYFTMYIFLVGLGATLMWLPQYIDNEVKWLLFPGDVAVVFGIYATMYFIATFTLTNVRVQTIRNYFLNKKIQKNHLTQNNEAIQNIPEDDQIL
ncbi:hypothetical protein H9M94_01450 [Mycoplasma sp. Pen4]|uniref:hypothetical protein n=1 Tax=Mycoplasma sp. Pen4 TaxID=640330 RepID=UPI0016546FB1|nr:hypothetical protein [Mycoplasma sp. Pen4]QNM93920.1 hypothetical protein H9M94_01450 [Mycoplasma sp. Pen4]